MIFYMKKQTVLIAQAGFSASALSAVSQPLRRHIGIYDQTHLKHLQACPLYFYAPPCFCLRYVFSKMLQVLAPHEGAAWEEAET